MNFVEDRILVTITLHCNEEIITSTYDASSQIGVSLRDEDELIIDKIINIRFSLSRVFWITPKLFVEDVNRRSKDH